LGSGLSGFPIPRQEFSDAIDRVVGDTTEAIAQVGFWIEKPKKLDLGKSNQQPAEPDLNQGARVPNNYKDVCIFEALET
jgi:hypothetical protein